MNEPCDQFPKSLKSTSVTDFVLKKPSPNDNVVMLTQPLNIEGMLVTLDVSKLDTSSDVKDSQPLNIEDILVTLDVSKLDTSSDVKELQYPNIEYILVTLDVSKLDTSSDVKDLQL